MRQFLASRGQDGFEDELPVIPQKYLMTVFLVQHPVASIGDEMYRQMRTLAEVLDLLLEGRNLEAMDMLMQRFKACQLVCRDRNWRSARWLELIPPDPDMTAVGIDEEELLRKIEYGELKLAELAAKIKGSPAG